MLSLFSCRGNGFLRGAIAKRLCTGLQIRVGRFDSGSRLQEFAAVAQLVERNLAKVEVESSRLFCRSKIKGKAHAAFPFSHLPACRPAARVVKLVDTRDLKSLGHWLYGFDPRPGHQSIP